MIYGYLRTSTEDQIHGIEAQRTVLGEYSVDEWVVEHASGKSIDGRPAFTALLARVAEGDTIVVTKLDRLARSVVDALTIFDQVGKVGCALIIHDLKVDTSTPTGRFMLTMLSAVAELERGFIADRTKAGLQAARESGVRLGRKPTVSHDQIVEMHNNGMSRGEIALSLAVSVRTVSRALSRERMGIDVGVQ